MDLSDEAARQVRAAQGSDMVSLISGSESRAQDPYIILHDANLAKYREDFESTVYSFTYYGRDNENKEVQTPVDHFEEEYRHIDEAYFDNVAC
eukprot:12220412-Karenia_brevis.AAC.1